MVESPVMQTLNIVVDSVTAEKLRDNAFVEVVLRRKDKKFKSFIKANIEDQEIARKVEDTISQSKDGFFNLSSKVQSLSYIDLGLTLANMAIDVAGFVIIANKMNALSDQLNAASAELGKLKDISVEDMRRECEKLHLDYSSFVTKIKDNDQLNRDHIENYLKTAKTFISKLIRLLINDNVDTEKLLNMIFTLLPAYTSMLCVFLRMYYFEKHKTPLIYDSLKDVYKEIQDIKFRNKVQDYYFLNKGYNYRDVIDIIKVQLYTIFSEDLELEDQLKLIEVFSDDEAYRTFEKSLDDMVESEIKECISKIGFSSQRIAQPS